MRRRRWKLVGSATRGIGRRAQRDVDRVPPKELRRLQRQIFVWQFPNERNRFSRNYKWLAWDEGEAQVLGDALIHYGYPSLARALSNLLNRVRKTQRQYLTSRGNKLQHSKDWVSKDYKMAASINRRISRAIREIEGKRKKRASGVRKSQRVFILQSEGDKCVAVLLRKRNPWNSAQYPSSDLHEWFSINLIRANSRREAVRAARKHWPEAKGPLTTRERQRLGV